MPHRLDDAYARIARADELLAGLRAEVLSFLDAEHDLISDRVSFDPEPNVPFVFDFNQSPVPDKIKVLTGDVIANIRDPLDYLVYALAQEDSGRVNERTQFPIELAEKRFEDLTGSWLGGVNAQHVDAIRGLQPFSGVQWTAQLKDLSNPHKHRRLHVARRNTVMKVAANADPSEATVALMDGFIRFTGTSSEGFTARLEVTVSLDVVFEPDVSVIGTLETLKGHVAQTLDAFKPDFR